MFQSNRKFKVWDYRVSHKQVLIRSPQTPDNEATNVDLVFWGVELLSIPSEFDGVLMSKGDLAEIVDFTPTENGDVFVIETNNRRFVIVARGCKVLENELDIFDSSLEGFAATEEGRNLGNVLAHS